MYVHMYVCIYSIGIVMCYEIIFWCSVLRVCAIIQVQGELSIKDELGPAILSTVERLSILHT